MLPHTVSIPKPAFSNVGSDNNWVNNVFFFDHRSDDGTCEILIKRGAHLNIKDRNQQETALSQAVYFGYEDNAQMLIREGADINLSDKRYNWSFV